jgi:3-oxoadipate enol-lactonase
VVVLDGPGHGRSEVPPPFTLEEHARAVVDAMDELRVETAVVVGLSWGGMTALRLGLYRPDRLRGLVVLDANADASTLRERLEYGLMVGVARRIGLPDAIVRARVVPLMFSQRTQKRSPEVVSDFVRKVGGASREGLAIATNTVSIARPSILGSLSAIRTPTLVGYGEDDVPTPLSRSQQIASRIRGATLVAFPGVGHMSALEDPAVVNPHLVPFVREHLGAPS